MALAVHTVARTGGMVLLSSSAARHGDEEDDVARIWNDHPTLGEQPFVVAPARVAGVDARTRGRVTWGCGGLLLGVLLAVVGLVVLAPHPTIAPAGPPPPHDISITIDDRYLTRLVGEGLAQANLPFVIHGVSAHVAPDNVVVIAGQVQIAGVANAELVAQAQAYASGDTIALRNLYGSIGGVPLASAATDLLQTAINTRIAAERQILTQGGIHYSVVGVSSATGQLTLHLAFA